MKIIIAGVPKAGKTTLAREMARECKVETLHTDDLIGTYDWSHVSQAVAAWFDRDKDFIIEGVATPRALRKWLTANPTGKPCDKVIWLKTPRKPLSAGQLAMSKGCLTVMNEIESELLNRGVKIVQQ